METQERPVPQWTLGERLRKARREKGIGIEEIAKQLGVSKAAVSHWEMGRTTPKDLLLVVRLWAEITEVPVEWLLGIQNGAFGHWFPLEQSRQQPA